MKYRRIRNDTNKMSENTFFKPAGKNANEIPGKTPINAVMPACALRQPFSCVSHYKMSSIPLKLFKRPNWEFIRNIWIKNKWKWKIKNEDWWREVLLTLWWSSVEISNSITILKELLVINFLMKIQAKKSIFINEDKTCRNRNFYSTIDAWGRISKTATITKRFACNTPSAIFWF